MRYEVNAVILMRPVARHSRKKLFVKRCLQYCLNVALLVSVTSFQLTNDVGRSSQADYLMRNVAMDDSIGGS